jgi:hypothetical protein
VGGGLDRGRLAEADHVLEHLGQRARILLEHPRPAVEAGGDRNHVLVGDGADLADRLGDDQIGGELREHSLVQLVERAALGDRRLHGGVDLAGVEVLAQNRPGQVGEFPRSWRVVALVRDADDAVAEPHCKEHLRGRGDEARDPHGEKAIFPTPNGRRRPPPKYGAT